MCHWIEEPVRKERREHADNLVRFPAAPRRHGGSVIATAFRRVFGRFGRKRAAAAGKRLAGA